MKMSLFSVFVLCLLLLGAGHGLPPSQSQPIKEPSEVSINSVESSGVISQTRSLNAVKESVRSETDNSVAHPGEGFVKHGEIEETHETSGRGKVMLPVTFPLIHGTSENGGVIQQSTRHADVGHMADSVSVAVTPVESQTQGLLGYSHGLGTGFAPILERIHHPKPFLLPLAAEAVQSLAVLPVTQTYYGGQFVNPVVVPPENEFGQIVIKTVEPIERTIPFYPLQVQPVVFGNFQQASELISSPKTEFSREEAMENGRREESIGVEANKSQKSVDATSTEGPGIVGGIENREDSKEVDSQHSPVNEKTPPGEVYHRVDFIGEDGNSVDPTHFSIVETSGKSVDKICFFVKKD